MRSKFCPLIPCLLVLALALPAHSWKIDTHIWLADHIVQELDRTGGLTIGDLGFYEPPAHVRKAILDHPDAFQLGVIGPDLYPDMVSGQMTTHPGLPYDFDGEFDPWVEQVLELLDREIATTPGWQTDDWLGWVRDRANRPSKEIYSRTKRPKPSGPEVAFAFGYMLHASMDTWAHSYINLYAGDVFSVIDEQEVETRHFFLEDFIKRRHWRFLDGPEPFEAVERPGGTQSEPESKSGSRTESESKPERKPERNRKPNPEKQPEPKRDLQAEAKTKSDTKSKPAKSSRSLQANAKFNSAIRSRAAAGPGGPSLGIQPFDPLSPLATGKDRLTDMHAPAEFVRRELILNETVAAQYAREPGTLHLWGFYMYWSEVQALNGRAGDVRAAFATAVEQASGAMELAQGPLDAADSAYQTALGETSSLYQIYKDAETEAKNAKTAFDEAKSAVLGFVDGISDYLLTFVPPQIREAYESARDALDTADAAMDDAWEDYESRRGERDELFATWQEELGKFSLKETAFHQIAQAEQMATAALDNGPDVWAANIEDALDAYIRAWEETGKELMRPKGSRFTPGHQPTKPMKEWLICWGPTFGAVPTTPASQGCENTLAGFNQFKIALDQTLYSVIPEAVQETIEGYDDKIQRIGGDLLVLIADGLARGLRIENGALDGYARSMINMRSKEVTAADLDAEFDNDGSTKGLVLYQGERRITNLVKRDMGIDLEGKDLPLSAFEGFAALQNSLTLAKLTLLDGDALDSLVDTGVKAHGSANKLNWTAVQRRGGLYGGGDAGAILLGAIRSIDGNHQWQEAGPLLPRRNGDGPSQGCRRHGYPSKSYADGCDGDPSSIPGKRGFRMWQDLGVREAVFNRIFKGPIAPGLAESGVELSQGIGTCELEPFPDSTAKSDACAEARTSAEGRTGGKTRASSKGSS